MCRRTVPLGLLAFLLALPTLAQESVVTATTWVDDWTGHYKGKVLLRKINGRWWTDDNREVYAPGKKGVFWEVDSKPDTCLFHRSQALRLDARLMVALIDESRRCGADVGRAKS